MTNVELDRQKEENGPIPHDGNINFVEVRENVRRELPVELWDTWEMADSEIDNIIDETVDEWVSDK